MYLKIEGFLRATLTLSGQERVKYFFILPTLYNSSGQYLFNAKNQTSQSCLCPERLAPKHLYFFKKQVILWAPSV
jgi:uncharacterized protein YdaU (DUF1376 family)